MLDLLLSALGVLARILVGFLIDVLLSVPWVSEERRARLKERKARSAAARAPGDAGDEVLKGEAGEISGDR